MFRHRFNSAHRHARSRWFGRRWLGRGLLLLAVPFVAAACHGRPHHHDNITEAEAKERADDHIDDAMDWLDGTDAQKQQVKQVVDTAIPDLMSYREEHKALREEFQKALAAPSVDASVLEDLRVRFLKLADSASARGVRALADVAQILTPQQRQKVVEKWRKFSG